MKKLFYTFIMLSLAILGIISCNKKEPDIIAKDASISINIEATTVNSITFTLTPENAVSYSYACVKKEDENVAQLQTVESAEPQEYTISDLSENTEYVIIATATNIEGKSCARVTENVITTSSASAKIVVRDMQAKALDIVISPINAAYYEYYCVKSSEVSSAEYIKVESDKSDAYYIENLEPETEYTISVKATNSNGETGEPVNATATTTKLPTITIDEIIPSSESATVNASCTDADSVFYAVSEPEKEPSENEYTGIKVASDKITIGLNELESDHEYSLFYFVQDKNGFRNEIASETFATIEKGDIGVEVSNIGMRDFDIKIYFNKEMYSKVYFICNDDETITDPTGFNWASQIRYCDEYTEDYSDKISNAGYKNIYPSTNYWVGIIAVDKENNLVEDAQVWKKVTTLNADFGYSDVSMEFEYKVTSTLISYKVKGENIARFWSYVERKDKMTTPEELAMKNTNSSLNTDLEKEYSTNANLTPETEYVLVGYPVDINGNFGKVVSVNITTPAIELNGKGSANIEILTSGLKTFNYNCEFGENTKQVRILPVLKNDPNYPTEKDIINELAVGTKKTTLYSSCSNKNIGGGMTEDTDYYLYYTTLDNEGNYSELQSIAVKTKSSEVIDGNAKVNVTRFIVTTQDPYTYLDYRIEKGENCKGFYRYWYTESDIEGLTDSELLQKVVSGSYYFNDTYDKSKESVRKRCYLIIVPVDNQDRLSPIVKMKLEESFE